MLLEIHSLKRSFHRNLQWAAIGLLSLVLIACGGNPPAVPEARQESTSNPAPQLEYVGGEMCSLCHDDQAGAWEGSHHDLAMQEADADTVLGNFEDASFRYNGIETTFFRRDGEFWIRTDGPDGKLADFRVAYTFGVEPLQQYLIKFPDGRLQALSICWDTRSKAEGGQRWFHLYPGEKVDFRDPLHWTGRMQNWNYMCAECHSTNLQENYHLEENKFDTTWTELDVSCEACHGPASGHLQWLDEENDVPNHGFSVSLRRDVTWVFAEGEVIAKQKSPVSNSPELNVCGKCHSRRSTIHGEHPPGQELLQTHRPVLLEAGLYYPDGQIQDEVYEWGSFLQSKMHAANVTCSDCHNPHSLAVYGGAEQACLICHQRETFASEKHHFHSEDSPGSSCINCHMPARTYMQVDERHDHSFRIPRPDLSRTLGVPNTCNSCHDDESPEWARKQIDSWLGGWTPPAHYGEALLSGREGGPGASERLLSLAADSERPPIVRATALADFSGNIPVSQRRVLSDALTDAEPLVRWGAIRATENLSLEERASLVTPLLGDSIRLVREQAGVTLAGISEDRLTSPQKKSLAAVLEDYRASQDLHLDRPESHLNLAMLAARLKEYGEAESHYKSALELDPEFVPAIVNLADLYKTLGREREGEDLLRMGISRVPENALLHHSLGLLLVRADRDGEALSSLKRAADLDPKAPRFSYLYGLSLEAAGRREEGLAVLQENLKKNPYSREILMALVTMNRDAGNSAEAANYLRRLLVLEPDDVQLQKLLQQLEQ